MNGNLGMPGGMGMAKRVAKSFLSSEWAEGISELIAAVEHELLDSVAALVDATDADHALAVPDPDDRAEQLRAGVQAIIEGDLPTWYLTHCVDCSKPERLAKFIALDADELQKRENGWVSTYRDKGADLPREEILTRHVERTYGLTLDEFRRLTGWGEDMEKEALRQVLVGNVEAAREGVDAVTAEVQEQ